MKTVTGEVIMFVKRQLFGEGEIGDRVYRTCSTGSSACRLSGIEVSIREDGSGVGDVVATCSSDTCPLTTETMQPGLDRLSDTALKNQLA